MKRGFALAAVLLGLAVVTLFVVGMSIPIFPGAMKWTASSLCPDGQPDPYVVRTEYSDGDGTSYNFSLFCMGERGDYHEVGVAAPFVRMFAWTYGVAVAATLLLILRRRWLRARRREQLTI
jgi:hypothetical protein